MKKIGILTFHNADNLGAVLQAYALQKTLENKCNVNAEVIDYRCEAIENSKKGGSAAGFISSLKNFPKRVYYVMKSKGIESFRKKIKMSSSPYMKSNIEKCNDKYDLLVFGSDQIWNLECSDNDYTYFGDFSDKKIKKASYAASIGEYEFGEENKEHICDMLRSFESISVRETSAKEKLKSLGIEEVAVHSDPVVLLKKDEWSGVMNRKLCKKKYVLVYLIQEDLRVLRYAEEYAKKNGLKVIYNKKSPGFILHNSPQDFLSWIYYAECVFTNSFHGTMLSVIFGKQLAAQTMLINGKENSRVADLLRSADLEQCILSADNSDGGCANADDIISQMRQNGIEYLQGVCKL